jgi:hypothetical protein
MSIFCPKLGRDAALRNALFHSVANEFASAIFSASDGEIRENNPIGISDGRRAFFGGGPR